MSQQDIASLVEFGLSPLQSRAYIAMLKLRACRASQLSAAIGILRPEAYRILRELSSKGLVQRNIGTPSKFVALSPDQALSILLEQRANTIRTLHEKSRKLKDSLATYVSNSDGESTGRISLITGGNNALRKTMQMINEANSEYACILSKYSLKRSIYEEKAVAMVKARKRGVRFRIITEIDNSNRKAANYLARHTELRKDRDITFCIEIADKKEALLGPALTDQEMGSDIEREVDIWTRNQGFVQGICSIFEKLWDVSPKYVRRSHS
jgi:sugar-specific transcriptional regulator TrmB